MDVLSSVKHSIVNFTLTLLVIQRVLSDDLETVVCQRSVGRMSRDFCSYPRRRYDIEDLGYENLFHGWVDVQGSGIANDYCRMVNSGSNIQLSCSLAGTSGCSENNFNSASVNFDIGHVNTWYMRDEDNDQRDDYCRCVGGPNSSTPSKVVCTKAGQKGFYGSIEQGGETNTFTMLGTENCEKKPVRPEFGREYTIP